MSGLLITVTLTQENIKAIAKEVAEIQGASISSKDTLKEETLYTVAEVAEMAKKSEDTIRRHIRLKLLSAEKSGKSYLISQTQYRNYINNNNTNI